MSPRTRGTESSQAHRDGKRGGGVGLAEGLGAPGADGDRVSGSRERRVWGRLAVTTGPQCEGPEHLPAAHLETVRMAYLCHVHFYRNKKKKKKRKKFDRAPTGDTGRGRGTVELSGMCRLTHLVLFQPNCEPGMFPGRRTGWRGEILFSG